MLWLYKATNRQDLIAKLEGSGAYAGGINYYNQNTPSGCGDINDWDVSAVTDMSSLFLGRNFNCDIGNWDVSAVTTMFSMFRNNQHFDQNLSNWNTQNVKNMKYMFHDTKIFNNGCANGQRCNLGWDLSTVSDKGNMWNHQIPYYNYSR